ncbi:MAG: peptidylprolyl isomerase [Saprospiraceae bacterium]|nr:peptidylprolyl isomerase [Saprospiraceae bacterium]
MIRLLAGILITSLIVFGCKKDDEPQISPEEQFAKDIQIIEDYLAQEGLVAERTASGLHYIILEEGSGEHPGPGDTVEVKYKGYLPDGRIFDQTRPATTLIHPLDDFIDGWTEGLQYLRSEGGKGMFLIPSELGYGRNVAGSIPANSVLIFELTLIKFF